MGSEGVPLVDDPELYFELGGEFELVLVANMVPTKPPESQPRSVDAAEDFMRQAAAGRMPKRAPLTVKGLGGGRVQVLDGNATYGVAVRHGFRELPVIDVEPEAG